MKLKYKSIISINDFSKDDIVYILKQAYRMERHGNEPILQGKIMASLFFEPSTRTRLSFETAMLRLGGTIIGFAEGDSTSTKKGESLYDTIKMVSRYADVIVIRHPLEGAARLASESSSLPVINAGDGTNQHPTQTFLDLYSIFKTHPHLVKQKNRPLDIAFMGDLKYGRTVHSLLTALSFFNCRMWFVSHPTLTIPDSYLQILTKRNIEFYQVEAMEDVIRKVDVLYATRIQAERFPDPIEYEQVKDLYRLRRENLLNTREGFKIMHPLPRVTEIEAEIDKTEAAYYFEQAANGIPVRKALLYLVLKGGLRD
ncbi:MAG: aspartate carbamoyltransferase [Candidatus Coatesbacteria bacterium]|nr:aspartate carbamoyltransferase [Candidatus Coatesbacteria bacterium]